MRVSGPVCALPAPHACGPISAITACAVFSHLAFQQGGLTLGLWLWELEGELGVRGGPAHGVRDWMSSLKHFYLEENGKEGK